MQIIANLCKVGWILRLSKGFIIICLLALAGYGWYQHQKNDVDVSESGFAEVGEIAGIDSGVITVIGPT